MYLDIIRYVPRSARIVETAAAQARGPVGTPAQPGVGGIDFALIHRR